MRLNKPPRIGKTGAQKLKDILDTPDPDLNKAMTTFGKGLYSTSAHNFAEPTNGTIKAIGTIRSRYKAIAKRIEKIDGRTVDKARPDVLDAIQRLDASLKGYAKALPQFQTAAGEASLRKYADRAVKASADLDKARDSI